MTVKTGSPKLIAIAEAATRQGTTALHILMQIKRGHLAGEEIDGVWYVTAASLARAAEEAPAATATPVCHSHCRGCGADH